MKLVIDKVLAFILILIGSYVKATTTETNNQNGIFGSFKMVMNKSGKVDLMLKGKSNSAVKNREKSLSGSNLKASPPPVTLGDVAPFNIKLPNLEERDPVMTNINLGEAPFFSGWVRYFKYTTDKNLKKPKAFFKNMEYLKQMKKNATVNTSELDDDKQYKYIHNDTYFFATLFENTLNIAKSKKVSISKFNNT
jgi:hypothetical protein